MQSHWFDSCQAFERYKVKSLRVGNCRDRSQRIPTFRAKIFVQNVSLNETLQLFEISHGSYQSLYFLPHLTLSTQYSTFTCIFVGRRLQRYTWRNADV